MKKKILIIGNDASIYIKRYIENILLDDFDVYLTSISNNNGKFRDYYIKKGVNIVNLRFDIPLVKDIPKLGGLLKLLTQGSGLSKLKNDFDIIHIHFMDHMILNTLYSYKFFKKTRAKIIGTFWGSDLFRVSDKVLTKIERVFDSLEWISMNSNDLFVKFHKVYGNEYDDKLRMIRWGVATYDDITSVLERESRDDCKKHFGIDKNKIVLSIGYNAIRQQQHLEALKNLSTLPASIWNNVIIVLPMTYGHSSETYINEVKAQLEKMNVEYKILSSFMSDTDIAKLRLATDIFIHAQTTDALSGTMQEYLYAGCIVLNPSWITYDELHELGVDYIEYKDFNALPATLEEILTGEISHKLDNMSKLYNFTSWKSVKASWSDLYI